MAVYKIKGVALSGEVLIMAKVLIIIGLILVALFVLILVLALCKSASIADEHADYLYYKMHRGDNNEDN